MDKPSGYVWVIDTGHAWLAVPISHVKHLGVSPGGESRVDIDNQVIFLERTHDAGEFLSRYVARFHNRPGITKQVKDYPAFVRALPRCTAHLGEHNGYSKTFK